MKLLTKICGLTTPGGLTAALDGGADFVGFLFHPASPRFIDLEVAAYLAGYVPPSVKIVGLFADADDAALSMTIAAVRLDMLQLHGDESSARVAEVRQKFGKPVMKALSIAAKTDLAKVHQYPEADWLLLDAKGTNDLPGGNGLAFDWSILDGFESPKPWMLAGGLTPSNVAEAVSLLRPNGVDVSSGVESSRGIKDEVKIRAFLQAAKKVQSGF